MLYPADCDGLVYYLPTPKSPHGVDIDPSGEYIVAGGKLATVIPVHSYTKMIKAIADKQFEKTIDGIPVLRYQAVIAGEVQKPGLGPLHTEFDGKGNAYTSMFISSEIVKWKLGTWQVLDRIPVYYSVGHLMIPGGDSKKPCGQVSCRARQDHEGSLPAHRPGGFSLRAADRHQRRQDEDVARLPDDGRAALRTGSSCEPAATRLAQVREIEDNHNPDVTTAEADGGITRNGKRVDVKMIAIRSHFAPDILEGIELGDTVYFHVTNIEQDWNIAHGFAVFGANTSGVTLPPGETRTLRWVPQATGIYPFYCTDFCSALHQEMQGYVRVSPAEMHVPLIGEHQPRSQADRRMVACLPSMASVPNMGAQVRMMSRLTSRASRRLRRSLLIGLFCPPAVARTARRATVPRGTRHADRHQRCRGGTMPTDLDNINGLNHYIGMKHITPSAIPELRLHAVDCWRV